VDGSARDFRRRDWRYRIAPAVASLLLQLRHDNTGTRTKGSFGHRTPVPGLEGIVSDMHDALHKIISTRKSKLCQSYLVVLVKAARRNVLELENIDRARSA
jgi:hypothetical protein